MMLRKKFKLGVSPGTLVAPEKAKAEATKITVIDYDPDRFEEKVIENVEDCFKYADTSSVTWINVDGLGDIEVVKKLGEKFNLHPLAQEDVLEVHQRPKIEDYGHYHFIVLSMLTYSKNLERQQVSMFLGQNFLITFQESIGDVFDPVRDRIRKGKTRIRSSGPDYLAYALIDALVDSFFPIMEIFGEEIEKLEDEIIKDPETETVKRIHEVKEELLTFRRAVWPERDMISSLLREEYPLIKKETRVFLRDCYDHVIQVMDMVETYRELTTGLMDVYLSSISNKTNEVMKVLTIIATIFIPLGVIAGIYGMNFNTSTSPFNMPELNWYWGYPTAIGLMVIIAGGLLIFFKRKGWL